MDSAVAFVSAVAAVAAVFVAIWIYRRQASSARASSLLSEVSRARERAAPTVVRARLLLQTWSPDRTAEMVDLLATEGPELLAQISLIDQEWARVGEEFQIISASHPLEKVRGTAHEAELAMGNYLLKIQRFFEAAFVTCDSPELALQNDYAPQVDKARTLLSDAEDQLDALERSLHLPPASG